MKKLLPLVFIFLYSHASAQNFDYLPAKVGNNQILSYTQFTLSYNEDHEQADWVAYQLTKDEIQHNMDRCNCFEDDNAVTSQSAGDSDYISTGFDRGHLSPSADNKMSAKANRESFLFSNMSPQLPSFNQGIWADLEDWVRNKVMEYDTVYVVTGPVFINNLFTGPKSPQCLCPRQASLPHHYSRLCDEGREAIDELWKHGRRISANWSRQHLN